MRDLLSGVRILAVSQCGTVASTASIGALMMGSGEIAKRGVLSSEFTDCR
jgi:ABC-type proline/glycine betaine transport system permease subunit